MQMLADMKIFLLFYCLVAGVLAAKKPKAPQKVDLPGISCDVCTMAIETLYDEVKTLRTEAPYNKVEELEIQNIIENMCKMDDPNGEWLRYVDIVTKVKSDGKSYAKLEAPGGISKCETECVTVAKSCEDLFENEIDQDDLSAILFKNKHSLERLTVGPALHCKSAEYINNINNFILSIIIGCRLQKTNQKML